MPRKQISSDVSVKVTFRGQTLSQARRAAAFFKVYAYDGGGLDGLVEGLDEQVSITATPAPAGPDEVLFVLTSSDGSPTPAFPVYATGEPVTPDVIEWEEPFDPGGGGV